MAVPPAWQALADEIHAWVVSNAAAARNRQSTYQANHGRYWQGVRWVVPSDGDLTAPDLSVHPTDQAGDWTAFGLTLPATMKMALRIDVYNGPYGQGWTLTTFVRLGGTMYARTWEGAGAEDRALGWRAVEVGR